MFFLEGRRGVYFLTFSSLYSWHVAALHLLCPLWQLLLWLWPSWLSSKRTPVTALGPSRKSIIISQPKICARIMPEKFLLLSKLLQVLRVRMWTMLETIYQTQIPSSFSTLSSGLIAWQMHPYPMSLGGLGGVTEESWEADQEVKEWLLVCSSPTKLKRFLYLVHKGSLV